jgi:hypothetical protein
VVVCLSALLADCLLSLGGFLVRVYWCYHRRSVGLSVVMSGRCRAPLWGHDQIFVFPFFCRTIAFLFVSGRSLWREDVSVICSAILQWSESLRTHYHILLSLLRLLGSLSVAFLSPLTTCRNFSGSILTRLHAGFPSTKKVEVEVTLRQTVSQYVLVSSTVVGLASRYYFLLKCCCLKFVVLFLLDALSEERMGMQFAV